MHSEHPIARAISNSTNIHYPVKSFKATPGKGTEAEVNSNIVKVVSLIYLKELDIDIEDERVDTLLNQGKTTVAVLINDKPRG